MLDDPVDLTIQAIQQITVVTGQPGRFANPWRLEATRKKAA
jgi:hypothetical protein